MTAEPEASAYEKHIRALLACRACPRVEGRPVTGAVSGAQVMLVGQAPGPREAAEGRPFAYTAGRTLFRWFETVGVDQESFRRRVHIGAVIRCFPGKDPKNGGDRVPDREEISRCAPHLERELLLLGPKLVIVVGTLAAQQLLGVSTLASVVGVLHRASRAGLAFDAVALPHPSGRSTWLNRPENRELLERSLQLIRHHPAFRQTVAGS